jgi:hypothetical protein
MSGPPGKWAFPVASADLVRISIGNEILDEGRGLRYFVT